MATIRDYFDTDFTSDLSTHQSTKARSVDSTINANVILRLHYAFNANAKYVSFYIPLTESLFDICLCLLTNIETTLSLSEGVEVQCGSIGQDEMIPDSELRFAGRVFI